MPANRIVDCHLLEVPEDGDRLHSAHQRRLSLLLAGSVSCVRDPRAAAKSLAVERELDYLVAAGFVRLINPEDIVQAAKGVAPGFTAPEGLVRQRFRTLLAQLGQVSIEYDATQRHGQITMLGHEYLPAPEWFPASEFTFTRTCTPAIIRERMQMQEGPKEVFRAIADNLQERLAAHVATLMHLAEARSADLVCTDKCASILRAIEESHLQDGPSPTYMTEGATLLATTVLRHAISIEDFEALPIEQVAEIAERCKPARLQFLEAIRQFSDDVAESDHPASTAARAARKHLLPELQAFDDRFGAPLKVLKSYVRDVVDKTWFTALPLVALGAAQGFNTAWALGVNTAVAAAKTTKERRRQWPRLLLELRRLRERTP